jgi:hypothetical protein
MNLRSDVEWCEDKGKGREELDQDMEGWPCGVLEGFVEFIVYGTHNGEGQQ